MPVGRPWVTRRENAPRNIDYWAIWPSSRCPEIHAVKAMYLYLFFGANLEDQSASVFIETRCFPSVSTAGEQFATASSRVTHRLHLQIGDKANQFGKTLISPAGAVESQVSRVHSVRQLYYKLSITSSRRLHGCYIVFGTGSDTARERCLVCHRGD